MSNFLICGGDEKNHGGNSDWEAQIKTQWPNLCDSQMYFNLI